MPCCCRHHDCSCGSGHHACSCHGHYHQHCGCQEHRHECSRRGERECGPRHGQRHDFPSREEYSERLEEERDLLERRLRFLKQELAELRTEPHQE